jgi:hypothetical protein
MKIMLFSTLLLGQLSSLISNSPALANEPGYADLLRVRNACSRDIKTFCTNVEPGKGRIMECLKLHKAEVSSTCMEAARPYAASANKLKQQ